jgi:hypothetical protein
VLGVALTVAGVGIGLVFPTVAAEVMTSVPAPEIGVASGANSALRERAAYSASPCSRRCSPAPGSTPPNHLHQRLPGRPVGRCRLLRRQGPHRHHGQATTAPTKPLGTAWAEPATVSTVD